MQYFVVVVVDSLVVYFHEKSPKCVPHVKSIFMFRDIMENWIST